MKKLLILLCVLFVASSASAIIEPGDNMMGLYFDQDADTSFIYNASSYSTHVMYMTLTHPTFNFLYGFEAGFDMAGLGMVINAHFTNPYVIDIGEIGNHIVGFGEPTPMQAANILMTFTVLYSDPNACVPLEFQMRGTIPSSINPAYPTVLLEDGELMMVGISELFEVSSAIYGDCPVSTQDQTFDGLKSLYR